MLYQVIHQHTPEQCPANHEGRTEAMNNTINEAHESGAVKILSWLHNSPSNRIFFVIEAHKYDDVQIMFAEIGKLSESTNISKCPNN